MFELTYRCNFFCRHCYVPFRYRKSKEVRTKQAFGIIDQLADIGCFYLGFTGGEPFVRKDFLKILSYAKRKGFQAIVYTNGSLINEKTAKELAELALNKVDITIPAMTQDAFEKITKLKGSHKKVFKAIELLKKNGVALGFKTCVLKENQDEIGEIQKFAHSQGALHRLDDMLSRRLDGKEEPYRYRGTIQNAGQGFSLAHDAGRVTRKAGAGLKPCLKDTALQLFKCGVGISQAAITPQGRLKPCLMIDKPRFAILGQSGGLKKAWEDLKRFIAGIAPDENYKCSACKLRPFCKWCPAKGWLYNKSFTHCDPQARLKAERYAGNSMQGLQFQDTC